MNKLCYLCFWLIFLSSPVLAQNNQWVEWIGDIEVSYGQNNNLNLSAFDNDEEDDSLVRVAGVFGRFYQINGTTRMNIALDIAFESYDDFGGMDNVSSGLSVSLRHKFGVGLNIPYVQFNLAYHDRNFDADVRDRDVFDLSLEVGKPFSERFSMAGRVTVTSTDGDSGPVVPVGIPRSDPFDQDFWTATVMADYVLSDKWLISADYTRRDGDFHSACTGPNVVIVLEVEQVKAITFDGAFAGCVYQVDGDAGIFSTSLSYAVSNHTAINFGIRFFEGDADVLHYSGRSFQLSYNYRY